MFGCVSLCVWRRGGGDTEDGGGKRHIPFCVEMGGRARLVYRHRQHHPCPYSLLQLPHPLFLPHSPPPCPPPHPTLYTAPPPTASLINQSTNHSINITQQLKDTPEAPALAQANLKAMGPMSKSEIITLATISGAVVLWMFGDAIGVPAVLAAMLALATLLCTGMYATV